MKITWLGHSGFRIEIGDQILLVDPWVSGNPVFDESQRGAAIAEATAILLSHAHFDHVNDAPAIARELDIPILGKFELANWLEAQERVKVTGFNTGGTVALGDVNVTMVHATHSSSASGDHGPVYLGTEAGYMIEHGGRTIYFSGDTDVMADMGILHELHRPEIGILCAGGHFTMDMKRAAFAAKRFFDFKTVIPCHYKTFPFFEQSAEAMKKELSGVNVVEAEVMKPFDL